MSGPNERVRVAAVLAKALYEHSAASTFDATCGTCVRERNRALALAERLLASDWLAERDRRTAATAVREAAEDLAPRASSDEPCENAEDCCGSATHCDAVRPLQRLVGEGWLRDRADQIEADQ